MAENITLARPYAQALFDLARTDDQLPAWSAALNIAALVVQDAGASEVLTNPMISDDQRVSLLAGICSEAGGEGGTVFAEVRGQSLLRLLAENGRLSVLPEIAARFNALKAAFENTVEVDLISAAEVDDATADKFKQGLQARLGRSVALNRSVDPQLVGGAIVRADDLVIDGSIKTRLQALAQRLGS